MSHPTSRVVPPFWKEALLTITAAVAMNLSPTVMSGGLKAQESPQAQNIVPLSIPVVDAFPPATPASTVLPSPDAAELSDDEPEAMLRGPVHEAFAEQVNPDPIPGLVITVKPPEPVEEVPPEVRPEGRTVEWISGYWAWDDDRNDFMWVSGIWREVPQGFRWLPGYWTEVEGGYQWVAGTWVSTATSEIEYLQDSPPQSLEQGPVGLAPTVEHIWIPGCWNWTQNRYVWRPGYWSGGYSNWVWVPARYHWTPRGYYYCHGYWDYPLERRGVLFAPCYFQPNVYAARQLRFTPRVVVASSLLPFHFWVRPRHQHYYFGDYYSTPYASRGIMPWHHYHRQHHGSDPLFCHYSRGGRSRDFYSQRTVQFNLFVNNPDRRPARTLRDQDAWDHPHENHRNHDHSRLGNRLQNLVDKTDSDPAGVRFVKLETDQRENFRKDAARTENLVRQRRDVESVTTEERREHHAPKEGLSQRIDEDETATGKTSAGADATGADKSQKVGSERRQAAGEHVRRQRPIKLKLPSVASETLESQASATTATQSGLKNSGIAETLPGNSDARQQNPAEKAPGEKGRLSEDRSQGRPRRENNVIEEAKEAGSTESPSLGAPEAPVSRAEVPKGVNEQSRETRHGRRKSEPREKGSSEENVNPSEPHRMTTEDSPVKVDPAAVPDMTADTASDPVENRLEKVPADSARRSAREVNPQTQAAPSLPASRSPKRRHRDDSATKAGTPEAPVRSNDAAVAPRIEPSRRITPDRTTKSPGNSDANGDASKKAPAPAIQSRAVISPSRTERRGASPERESRTTPLPQKAAGPEPNRERRDTSRAAAQQPPASPPAERVRAGRERAAPAERGSEPAGRPAERQQRKGEGHRGRSKP